MNEKRNTCVPYLGLLVQLHSCVKNPTKIQEEMEEWLKKRLNPDYDSDIEVNIMESAGAAGMIFED